MQFDEILFKLKFSWFFEKKFSLLSNSFMNEEPTLSRMLSCFNDDKGLSRGSGSSLPVTAVSMSYLTTFCDLTGV